MTDKVCFAYTLGFIQYLVNQFVREKCAHFLFTLLNPEQGIPVRSQGVWVNDQEIEKVINYWRKMRPTEKESAPWEDMLEDDEDSTDELVEEAISIVRSSQRASASMLQRRLRVGYPRAASLIDQLEAMGVVGPSQGGGREREVLVPPEGEDEGENHDEG